MRRWPIRCNCLPATSCSNTINFEAAGNPIIPRTAPFEGDRVDAFKAIATAAKKHGALILAQISLFFW